MVPCVVASFHSRLMNVLENHENELAPVVYNFVKGKFSRSTFARGHIVYRVSISTLHTLGGGGRVCAWQRHGCHVAEVGDGCRLFPDFHLCNGWSTSNGHWLLLWPWTLDPHRKARERSRVFAPPGIWMAGVLVQLRHITDGLCCCSPNRQHVPRCLFDGSGPRSAQSGAAALSESLYDVGIHRKSSELAMREWWQAAMAPWNDSMWAKSLASAMEVMSRHPLSYRWTRTTWRSPQHARPALEASSRECWPDLSGVRTSLHPPLHTLCLDVNIFYHTRVTRKSSSGEELVPRPELMVFVVDVRWRCKDIFSDLPTVSISHILTYIHLLPSVPLRRPSHPLWFWKQTVNLSVG